MIDKVINRFYQQNYWGYSLPNYLSAMCNVHPSYVGTLMDKQTLTVEDMYAIFSMMDTEEKMNYNSGYLEKVYNQYMNRRFR